MIDSEMSPHPLARDRGLANQSRSDDDNTGWSKNDHIGPIDFAQAERFIQLIADAHGTEVEVFQTYDDSEKKRGSLVRCLPGTFARHRDELVRLNACGAGVFMTVNATDRHGRKANNITHIRALFVDLDGAPLEPLLSAALEPHVITQTSANRWHAFWLIDAIPADAASFTRWQKSLIRRFNADASVHDLPRVMRLPGFFHRKGEPFQSQIIHESGALPYRIDDLIEGFDLDAPPAPVDASKNRAVTVGRHDDLLRLTARLARDGLGHNAIHAAVDAEQAAGRWSRDMPADEVARAIDGALAKYSPAAAAEHEWPEIVTLESTSPGSLPIDGWPPVLREYALGASRETETPPELAGMLALASISAAVQRSLIVQVKRGYREPVCIFTAVVLPPATRKSAEQSRATAPLIQWESDQARRIADEARAAKAEREVMEHRIKKMRADAAKESDPDVSRRLASEIAAAEAAMPQVPMPPRIWTGDVTPEHLATMMNQNRDSMAILSAEGGIFATMAGRYNAASVANLDLFLQGHAGDAVRVDRGSKPPVVMDNPRLTMGLAIQPDVLASMSTRPEFRGRGLLGRVLFVIPESGLGSRTGNGEPMPAFAEVNYHSIVRTLLDQSRDGDETPQQVVRLSTAASRDWHQMAQDIERELADGGRFEHCRDWGGKLAGAVARIAGLFHAVNMPDNPSATEISAEEMAAAITTGWALADHALCAFQLMGADPDIEGARLLLRWIRRHGLATFTVRDAHQNHKSRFKRGADIEKPLEVLIERGYIQPLPVRKEVGRPSVGFEVNPAAHTQF